MVTMCRGEQGSGMWGTGLVSVTLVGASLDKRMVQSECYHFSASASAVRLAVLDHLDAVALVQTT